MTLIFNIGVLVDSPKGQREAVKQRAIQIQASKLSLKYCAKYDGQSYLFSEPGIVVPLSLASYLADIKEVVVVYWDNNTSIQAIIKSGIIQQISEFKSSDLEHFADTTKIQFYGNPPADLIPNNQCEFYSEFPDFGSFGISATKLKFSSKATLLRILLWFFLLGSLGFTAFAYLTDESEKSSSPEDIALQKTMHYQTFLMLNNSPNMYLELQAVHDAVLKFSNIEGWIINRCNLNGIYITCVVKPTKSALLSTLRAIPDTNLQLAGETVELTTTLEFSKGVFEADGISTPVAPVIELFFDRLGSQDSAAKVTFTAYQKAEGLERQDVNIVKASTGLHFLESVAESSYGLPMKLQSLSIEKQGAAYLISFDGYAYSTYPFVNPVQGL